MADSVAKRAEQPCIRVSCIEFTRYGKVQCVLVDLHALLRPSRTLGAWFVQLWAESLKEVVRDGSREVRVGQTPVQAIGATDQHAQVQLFVEGPRGQDGGCWG